MWNKKHNTQHNVGSFPQKQPITASGPFHFLCLSVDGVGPLGGERRAPSGDSTWQPSFIHPGCIAEEKRDAVRSLQPLSPLTLVSIRDALTPAPALGIDPAAEYLTRTCKIRYDGTTATPVVCV